MKKRHRIRSATEQAILEAKAACWDALTWGSTLTGSGGMQTGAEMKYKAALAHLAAVMGVSVEIGPTPVLPVVEPVVRPIKGSDTWLHHGVLGWGPDLMLGNENVRIGEEPP